MGGVVTTSETDAGAALGGRRVLVEEGLVDGVFPGHLLRSWLRLGGAGLRAGPLGGQRLWGLLGDIRLAGLIGRQFQ
jgi:hypothetical protein